MKKIMILFGKSNWQKTKPFANQDYQYSYECFYDLCQKNNIQMYRASYQWYDYKKGLFQHAWIFEGKGGNWKKVSSIQPDLIYDKTKARTEIYYKKELINKKYPFINDLQFTQILDNKLTTSLLFKKWSKKNWLVENKYDLNYFLPQIKTNLAVLKPLSESGGRGVQILKKSKILEKAQLDQPYLLQEFVDSSQGVPGFSHKMHDLRLVFVNNKLIYSYIREPAQDSYLANLAQGGNLLIIPKNKLPQSLNPIIKEADRTLETFYPRIYAIDFMFDEKKRPWIIELNSMPGLYFTSEEKPYIFKLYKEMIQIFKKELN